MYMKARCETELPVCVYVHMNTGCTVATALVCEFPYMNVRPCICSYSVNTHALPGQ